MRNWRSFNLTDVLIWAIFRIEAHQNQHRYSQSQALSNGNGNGNGSSNSSEYVSSQYQQNGTNDNFQHIPSPVTNPRLSTEAPKEILSVSGKKKCSYCSEELGKSRTNYSIYATSAAVRRHFREHFNQL